MNDALSAKKISQRMLDQTGNGLLTGDFDLFADCFLLPQDIETFDDRRRLETRQDLFMIYNGVRAYHEKMGVTDMVRHVVTADFRDPKTISSIHQSRLVTGSTLVQKPYNVFSVLHLKDDVWRIGQSQYAVDDAPGLCRALVGAIAEPTP